MPKKKPPITLSIVPALVAACGPAVVPPMAALDPCAPAFYSVAACDAAVLNQGYYYNGLWYSHIYSHPSFYYRSGYDHYISIGGRPYGSGMVVYAPPSRPGTRVGGGSGGGSFAGGGGGTVRGGFGGTGGAFSAAS